MGDLRGGAFWAYLIVCIVWGSTSARKLVAMGIILGAVVWIQRPVAPAKAAVPEASVKPVRA